MNQDSRFSLGYTPTRKDRLARAVRTLRRSLAKAIEPKKPEPDLLWDIPLQGSLGGANQLREKLAISEDSYLFALGSAFADSRAYVLYTALDEVMKTAMYLVRLRELMQGPKISAREDILSRLILSHVLEEQDARERRLLEVLITLILFETTNEQAYYRDLLLLEELDGLLAAQGDLREFYTTQSSNIGFSIDRTIAEIRQVENQLERSKLWFRHPDLRMPLPKRDEIKLAKPILSSFRKKLKSALPLMTDNEKILFGLSYAGYGQKSESIHYHVNPSIFVLEQGRDMRNVLALGLLNFSILIRCHKLMGEPPAPMVSKLSGSHEGTDSRRLVHQITERDISIGDFVLAFEELAEVLEVIKSPYGYQSFRVRYLAERPIDEIKEDCIPAYYIRPLYKRSQFIKELRLLASQGKIAANLVDNAENMSSDQIGEILRSSVVKIWKLGLRDWVKEKHRRRPVIPVHSGHKEI